MANIIVKHTDEGFTLTFEAQDTSSRIPGDIRDLVAHSLQRITQVDLSRLASKMPPGHGIRQSVQDPGTAEACWLICAAAKRALHRSFRNPAINTILQHIEQEHQDHARWNQLMDSFRDTPEPQVRLDQLIDRCALFITKMESDPLNPDRITMSDLVHRLAREHNPQAPKLPYYLRLFADTIASTLDDPERQELLPLARELADRACQQCDQQFKHDLIETACDSAVPGMLRHIGVSEPLPPVQEIRPCEAHELLKAALPDDAPQEALQAAMDACEAWFDTWVAVDGHENAPINTALSIAACAAITGQDSIEAFTKATRHALDQCRCPPGPHPPS